MKKITKSLWSELGGSISVVVLITGLAVKINSRLEKIEYKQTETNTRLNHISDSLGFFSRQVLETKKESYATTTVVKESDPTLAKKIDALILTLDRNNVNYEKKNMKPTQGTSQ